MPQYDYKCILCSISEEEVRNVEGRDRPSKCPMCGIYRERLFPFPRQVSFGTFQEGFNQAFGKVFTTPHQLKNEISRIKGEEGKEIVEIGNDRAFPKKPKPVWPDKHQMVQELRKGWK